MWPNFILFTEERILIETSSYYVAGEQAKYWVGLFDHRKVVGNVMAIIGLKMSDVIFFIEVA